ncbi:MAG: cell wall-active antibiotics response protein [Mediterranea sp.]|jgi:predicted membrane protein|nr:cell wall-active antibiotics response protein [Mediterranea sp.]
MNAFIKHRNWHHKLNIIATAAIFIIVGLLFLGRNLGLIDDEMFHAIVSWQTLLIVIGLLQLLKERYVSGVILVVVGAYFLSPVPFGLSTYWPVLLIGIGVLILSKLWRGGQQGWCQVHTSHEQGKEEVNIEDGFIESDVSFGASKHIMLDPVFRGGKLNLSFGSILLDLRRTRLEERITYLNVDASFGGIDIFVPSHWDVKVDVNNTLGGVDDKRTLSPDPDREHQLVIRGNISFSGITVKS